MQESKTISFKELIRLVWLFSRRKVAQRQHIFMILEAYEYQDKN